MLRLFFSSMLLLSWTYASFAAVPVEKLGLREAIERAMHDNHDLRAQKLQAVQAAEEIRRVHGEFGPHFEGLLGVGPITKANGDATRVVEDKDVWGRTIVGKVSFTLPIFTWGREGNYELAAKSGVNVKESENALKENELRYQVKETFFGYQLAHSLQDFIGNGKADLMKALDKRNAKRKPGAKEDFKLEIFLHEVEAREAEVNKYYDLAKDGFALRVGAERGTVLPKDEWLLPEQREHRPVEHYVSLALSSRPEFRQLAEGIFAKRNLAKAEWKGMLPLVGLMASYEAADTNVRNPQPGVFSYDPYNHKTTTGGIGLKWDFQWQLQDSKAAKFRAEAEELEAKEIYAKQGIETEVRKAFYELVEAETRLKAATEAYKAGKKWLTGEAIGFGSGLGNSQALVDAYEARAMTAKTYFEAVFRHHMAWAALSKAVGVEVDPALAGARN